MDLAESEPFVGRATPSMHPESLAIKLIGGSVDGLQDGVATLQRPDLKAPRIKKDMSMKWIIVCALIVLFSIPQTAYAQGVAIDFSPAYWWVSFEALRRSEGMTPQEAVDRCFQGDEFYCVSAGTRLLLESGRARRLDSMRAFRIACGANSAEGCLALALNTISSGRRLGIPQRILLQRACGAGAVRACTYLGLFQDEEAQFQSACQLGDSLACGMLGSRHLREGRVTQAVEYLERGCNGGSQEYLDGSGSRSACLDLANLYEGLQGFRLPPNSLTLIEQLRTRSSALYSR